MQPSTAAVWERLEYEANWSTSNFYARLSLDVLIGNHHFLAKLVKVCNFSSNLPSLWELPLEKKTRFVVTGSVEHQKIHQSVLLIAMATAESIQMYLSLLILLSRLFMYFWEQSHNGTINVLYISIIVGPIFSPMGGDHYVEFTYK